MVPNEIPLKTKAYLAPDQTFEQLKIKLANYLNKLHNVTFYTSDSVRLWKSNYNYTDRVKIVDFFKYHDLGGPDTKFKESSDPDIEENSGKDFPGLQFDMNKTKT